MDELDRYISTLDDRLASGEIDQSEYDQELRGAERDCADAAQEAAQAAYDYAYDCDCGY